MAIAATRADVRRRETRSATREEISYPCRQHRWRSAHVTHTALTRAEHNESAKEPKNRAAEKHDEHAIDEPRGEAFLMALAI